MVFSHKAKSNVVLAALSFLLALHIDHATEESLCSNDADGRQECKAVAHDRDAPDHPRYPDADDPETSGQQRAVDNDGDSSHRDADGSLLAAEVRCVDLHDADECRALRDAGECDENPGFTKYRCASSCGTCRELEEASTRDDGTGTGTGEPCTDMDPECMGWAAMGECGFNPEFMLAECERSCVICFEDTNQFGVHQELPSEDSEDYAATKEVIDASITYMRKIWSHDVPGNERINYKCRNMHEDCSLWAIDECDEEDPNGEYMRSHCAPACQTCHTLDTRLRCPIEEGNEPVLGPGGLNALFERIVDDPDGEGEHAAYNPRALSRPRSKADGTPAPGFEDDDDNEEDGPWIVLLENFVSDEEALALIAAGHVNGYERSSDVGIENPDGTREDEVSDGRTSHNSWCDVDLCDSDPVVGPVVERIAAATGTVVGNSEFLQLLRYEPGQYYRRHHDYIEYQQGLPCGVRMLTLFLYLNDVEEGGGTRFPLLNLTVQPKKGSALLWPSVLDEDPEEKDFRTDHEALPVLRGIKYGANAWIHTRKYKEAEDIDCA